MTNEPEAPEAELSARLRANCVGQPAEIAWPHRILHEAANALDAQAARIAELEERLRELEAERDQAREQYRLTAMDKTNLVAKVAELEAKLKTTEEIGRAFEDDAGQIREKQKELEAKLAKAMDGLRECEGEIDQYIRNEYPHDHPVQERYRKRDFDANPARITLAEIQGNP